MTSGQFKNCSVIETFRQKRFIRTYCIAAARESALQSTSQAITPPVRYKWNIRTCIPRPAYEATILDIQLSEQENQADSTFF